MSAASLQSFARDYAAQRQAEGRGYAGEDLLALPYITSGTLARQWAVRARSFDAFQRRVIHSMAKRLGRPLDVLDLGAGNGWLSYRMAQAGHRALALDIRHDDVDGLGASQPFLQRAKGRMRIAVADFDEIPANEASFDVAVFNAALHYATNLAAVLAEAARVVRPGGQLVILDSPVYRGEADGLTMVAEKTADAPRRFGARAESLIALPFIEFLTRERLAATQPATGVSWRRSRVLYPLWYELRPLEARLRGARAPSRFDLWIGARP
jgi:SAM-dependent methyltransferase